MHGIDGVAKKALAERSQGMAEKMADKKAPAPKKMMKPEMKDAARSKKSMTLGVTESNPFAKLERDLPKGGSAKKMAIEAAEEGGEKIAKKGLGKLGRMGVAGLAGGAIGLGVNALMEGLDAEEAGSEEEQMDEAAMGQYMKTEAKLKKDKLKNSLQSSTKKQYSNPTKTRPLPDNVKKTTVMPTNPEVTMDDYEGELRKNYGAMDDGEESDDYGFGKVVKKVMGDEMRKAAKKINRR